MAIHERGLQHNDFQVDNLVIDDAEKPPRIFVIDFDGATLHKCARKKPIKLYALPADPVEFDCDELWKVAEEIAIWTPGAYHPSSCFGHISMTVRTAIFPFEGTFVLIDDAPDAATLVDKHASETLLSRGREHALSVARKAMKAYGKRWKHRKDYLTGDRPCRELTPAMPPHQDSDIGVSQY